MRRAALRCLMAVVVALWLVTPAHTSEAAGANEASVTSRDCEVIGFSPGGSKVLPGTLVIRDIPSTVGAAGIDPAGSTHLRAYVELDVARGAEIRLFKFVSSAVPTELREELRMPDFFLFKPIQAPYGRIMLILHQPGLGQFSKMLPQPVRILDAADRPASGFRLEVKSNDTTVLDHVLDEKAVLRPIYVQTASFAESRWVEGAGSLQQGTTTTLEDFSNLELTVHHPSNGMSQTMRYPPANLRADGTWIGPSESVTLSLPPAEGAASDASKVFRGVVVNEAGAPLPNAVITVSWVELPGHGGRQIDHGPLLRAGTDGKFELWANALLADVTGQPDMPKAATLTLRVSAPEGAGTLATQSAIARPNEEVRVVLSAAEGFRGRLRTADGTDATAGREPGWSTAVQMIRKDLPASEKNWRNMHLQVYFRVQDDGSLQFQPVPVPGTYELEYDGRRYAQQRLEPGVAQSGVVVWTQVDEDSLVYRGRAVNARSGEPVADAYAALVDEGNAPWLVADMPQEDRDRLWKDAPQDGLSVEVKLPNSDQVRLADGRTLFALKAVARTNAEGRFTMTHPGGKAGLTFVLWSPGMLGVKADPYTITGKNKTFSGTLDLGDAPLIPALHVTAKVLPPAILPDEHLRPGQERKSDSVSINTIVSFDRPTTATAKEAGWALAPPALNPMPGRGWPWHMVTGPDWHPVGQEFTLLAPADVKFTLTGSTAQEPTLGGAFWPDLGPAPAGSKLRLEPKPMTVKKPYIISVRNADGTPQVGVAVRVDGMLPLITDAQGEVTAWTAGSTVSRIEVMKGQGWEIATSVRDANIPPPPAPPKIEITMPADGK